jgi:hypothetical protein
MHSLYGSLKKNSTAPSSVGDLILSAYDSGKPRGWLGQLSWLRNQTVHEEPIRSLVETKLLTVREIATSVGPFMTIYLGVPTDPKSVTNKAYVDALSYFKDLMVQMLEFSRAIAAASPVPPKFRRFRLAICCKGQNLPKPNLAPHVGYQSEETTEEGPGESPHLVQSTFTNFHKGWRCSSETG